MSQKKWISQLLPFLFIQSPRELSRISISDLTSTPLPSSSSNSPRMDSDGSIESDFNTISNFNNSDVETLDEFLDSEPSFFFIFLNSVFNPKLPLPLLITLSPSSHTDPTLNLSPLSSNEHDVDSTITDDQIEFHLDEFINHQQQIHNTNSSLRIHQLTH